MIKLPYKILSGIFSLFVIIGGIYFLYFYKSENLQPEQNQRTGSGFIQEDNTLQSDECFICTGPMSKRYHKDKYCKGLSKCSGYIKKEKITEAISNAHTPCKICWY
jgi:hypothetical protein